MTCADACIICRRQSLNSAHSAHPHSQAILPQCTGDNLTVRAEKPSRFQSVETSKRTAVANFPSRPHPIPYFIPTFSRRRSFVMISSACRYSWRLIRQQELDSEPCSSRGHALSSAGSSEGAHLPVLIPLKGGKPNRFHFHLVIPSTPLPTLLSELGMGVRGGEGVLTINSLNTSKPSRKVG